jgi:glutathione S-transferase
MLPTNANIVLHSIRVPFLVRAAVVGLLLSDAGIRFTEKAYSFAEWGKVRQEWRQAITKDVTAFSGNPYTAVPTLQINGKWYAQLPAILRYLARETGQYDGRNSEEAYLVDAFSDVITDWRNNWIDTMAFPAPVS